MPGDPAALAWAFGWGLIAGAGVLAGALLALVADLPHRAIAAIMSVGAGLVLAAASVELAAESLREAGPGVTAETVQNLGGEQNRKESSSRAARFPTASASRHSMREVQWPPRGTHEVSFMKRWVQARAD